MRAEVRGSWLLWLRCSERRRGTRHHLRLLLVQSGSELLLEDELLVLGVELVELALEYVVFIDLLIEHQGDFIDLKQTKRRRF